MVKIHWGKPVPSQNPSGRPPRPTFGIQERYIQPSTYTVDEDPDAISGARQVAGAVTGLARTVVGDDPPNSNSTLEELAARIDRIEQAIYLLATGGTGEEGQDGSDQPGAGPDESSPFMGDPNAQPKNTRPGMMGDRRRTTADQMAAYLNGGKGMRLRRDGTRSTLESMNAANQLLRRR